MLDEVRRLGEEVGFFYTDYGVGVISLALRRNAPDLGIWIHADVVPEGDGWDFEPYNASEYKDWVIGRGARDNKGSLVASFLTLKILLDNGLVSKTTRSSYGFSRTFLRIFTATCFISPRKTRKWVRLRYAHSVDEAASIKDLLRSIKIYVRALLALNEMDW